MEGKTEEVVDYEKTKYKLLSFLESEENAVLILAASANDIVMASSVLIFSDALDFDNRK